MTDTYNFNPTATTALAASVANVAAQESAGHRRTVLIVEDQHLFRAHLQTLLHEKLNIPHHMIEVCCSTDGVRCAVSFNADLLVMDIAPASLSDFTAAQKVWLERPQTKILFWAHQHHQIYARKLATIAPPSAIYGFIMKSASDADLVHAITSMLLHDQSYFDPNFRLAMQSLQSRNCLTDVELQTLRELAMGLTDKAMALRSKLTLRGIQCRTKSLYRKLLLNETGILQHSRSAEMVNLRARVVFEAIRRGLIIPEEMSFLDSECLSWIGTILENPEPITAPEN